MVASWAKGENAPLAAERYRVTVEATRCLDLSVLLLDRARSVRSDADFVFYNQPNVRGVTVRTQDAHGGQPAVELDLAAVDADVERLVIAASLDDANLTFRSLAPPIVRLERADGTPVGIFTMGNLTSERAVMALELYRRAGGWKVRAVGQGYDGGLGELATAHGVAVERDPSPTHAAASSAGEGAGPARVGGTPVPAGMPIKFTAGSQQPPPPEPDPSERAYDQLWGVFGDLARSAAAFRSASDFANQRLETELDQLLADPSTRNAPSTATAMAQARQRRDDLLARATADNDRDNDHLRAELADLAGRLPAPMAGWQDAAWQGWIPPSTPVSGVRLGTLNLAERPGPAVPFVVRLPLVRPLLIDSSGGQRGNAVELARTLAARLLAASPAGAMTLHVADPGSEAGGGGPGGGSGGAAGVPGGGAGSHAFGTLLGRGVPPLATVAGSPAAVTSMVADLSMRVDMVRMALQANAVDEVATIGARLLLWYDFPFGLDERSLAALRFLLSEGAAAGVSVILVGDPEDLSTLGPTGQVIDDVALRLPAAAADIIRDPWVGLNWVYTPDSAVAGFGADRVFDGIASVLPP